MPLGYTPPVPPDLVTTDIRRFPGIKRLASEYATNFAALAPFFAGDPEDDAAWRAAIAARAGSARGVAETSLLQNQQRTRGAPEAAIAAAGRLATPGAIAIVTGQQAGLFGGPFYTLLKAISAIRWAREVEQRYGTPAVAVFWVDAEDHDLDEIRKCSVLDSDLVVQTLELSFPSSTMGAPAATVRLSDEIVGVLDALATALPATDFTDDLVTGLRHAYAEGRGLVEAFSIWLEQCLGHLGLVVFDASEPAAKPLVTSLFEQELQSPGITASLARDAGARLESEGFHAQVEPTADTVALFLLGDTRVPIRHDEDGFRLGDNRLSIAQLKARLHGDASCFGPNVLLRPIVQDRLFPTACYVAGPNELAYLGQLREVYQHFGVPMPLIAPRLSVSVVDAAVIKFVRRYALDVESLQARDEALLNRLLDAQLPDTVDQAIRDTETATRIQMQSLAEAVGAVDPTLSGAAESALGRMERDFRNLRNKVIQAVKRQDQTLRRQFARSQAQLFPNGTPQERALSGVHFLNRHGPALIEHLVKDTRLNTTHHWVISV